MPEHDSLSCSTPWSMLYRNVCYLPHVQVKKLTTSTAGQEKGLNWDRARRKSGTLPGTALCMQMAVGKRSRPTLLQTKLAADRECSALKCLKIYNVVTQGSWSWHRHARELV